MIGQSISHFIILEEIGRGGMGIVYKARDTKLDRIVALKFLPQHLTSEETERARFLQEAKAAATLNHPNICTIHGIEEDAGRQFIEMEYVDGVTLRRKLPVEKLDVAVGYAIQIGEALEEAHANGVVHRDIKAENIMVNVKNQIKVMDFGLAKLKGSLKLTRSSSTVGTLAYMSPEQIQGGEVDARSDIFSFGIVLYEMVSGQFPFKGEHEAAMMYCILNEQPEPIQKYRPDLPAEFLHILDRALEKDPAERYQSVSDMLIDLRRVKKQTTKVKRTSVHEIPPEEKEQPVRRPTPYSRALAISLGAILFCAVASFMVWKLFFTQEAAMNSGYPFRTFKPTRISTEAPPLLASISPDGKYVVYVIDESGKQSVWMRQVSAASSVRVLPPTEVRYAGFTFSPDGDYVYYSVLSEINMRASLFVVPTLGGTPRKILDGISGAVAVSPDGKQLSFVRAYPDEGEETLITCAADGSNERKLVVRKGEDFFLGKGGQAPVWSPDGKTIAVPIGTTAGRIHMSVLLVSFPDGSTRITTAKRWNEVGHLAWVNGSDGLLAVADEYLTGATSQLWYLDVREGTVHQITRELTTYDASSLSVTSSQSVALALQQNSNSAIEIVSGPDWRRDRRLASRNGYEDGVGGMDWSPDGRIVYGSLMSGNADLWIIDAEGRNRQQLTATYYEESAPSVSWDGRFIAYSSSRDTTPHIWRMDIDGNNQKNLTTGDMDDYAPRCSPDNRWIYFDSYRDKGRRNLWKVAADGGQPVKVSDDFVIDLGISPDGKWVLGQMYETKEKRWSYGVLSAESGTVTKTFNLPLTASRLGVEWMPDAKGISYVDTRNGTSNIWVLPFSTMKPYQLTHFDSDLIANFAWSRDGKSLALARGEDNRDLVLLTNVK